MGQAKTLAGIKAHTNRFYYIQVIDVKTNFRQICTPRRNVQDFEETVNASGEVMIFVNKFSNSTTVLNRQLKISELDFGLTGLYIRRKTMVFINIRKLKT